MGYGLCTEKQYLKVLLATGFQAPKFKILTSVMDYTLIGQVRRTVINRNSRQTIRVLVAGASDKFLSKISGKPLKLNKFEIRGQYRKCIYRNRC